MSRYTWVKIDLNRLRQNLSTAEGRVYSFSQAESWLCQNGFMPSHGGWVTTTETDLAMLRPGELLDGHAATPAEVEASRDAEAAFKANSGDDVPPETAVSPVIRSPAANAEDRKRSSLDFPMALVGSHRDVTRRWKSVTRRAVEDGNWETAVRDLEMRSIHDVAGTIVRSGPIPFLPADCILLYPVLDLLMPACKQTDRNAWYAAQRGLILAGFDYFWFCLASLAQAEFLIATTGSDTDMPNVAMIGLPSLLRWWDVFCDLAHRYYSPLEGQVKWTSWGSKALWFSKCLGMPDQDRRALYDLDARAAGRRMSDWFQGLGGNAKTS